MTAPIARFLRVFPDGFKDPEFLAKERGYKVDAADFLRSEMPLEVAMEADEQACATAARAFGRTNLLSLFEQSRVREVLKGPDGPAFVKAAAGLAMGDLEALEQMATVLKPGGAATWPVMTYLPFFWSPGEHMFLKPTVTVEFAERIGHRFARDYGHEDRAAVYRSLITMKDQTIDAIVALQPADGIDVQSFIWVVGAYDGPS